MRARIPKCFWLSIAVYASASAPAVIGSEAFSMQITDAFAITGRGTVMTGRVATGSLESGDTVCIPMKSGEILPRRVDGIERFRKMLERAEAGQMVGVAVSGEVDSKQVKKGADLTTGC